MTKFILGDNPFFDINHSSGGADKGFRPDLFADCIHAYAENGGDILMLSAHEEHLPDIISTLKQYKKLKTALVYPLPHTVNDRVASEGYIGLFKLINLKAIFFAIITVLLKPLVKDKIRKILYRNMIYHFYKNALNNLGFEKSKVSHICLHNIWTDLLLASGDYTILHAFEEAIKKLDLDAVILTQNCTNLVKNYVPALDTTISCGSINKLEYMMNDSFQKLSQLPNYTAHRIWAMQILAGGNIPLPEALLHLENNVDRFIYASSKPERIAELAKVN